MARELFNRAFAPTVPKDLADPPRFSQLVETTKDVLVQELRNFFDSSLQGSEFLSELPTIEKYATFGSGLDQFSTAVNIVRKFPDSLENLPHVAVMAATGQERKLTIGPPYIATVQDPPRVISTLPEPYALVDGDALALRVHKGRQTTDETVTFTSNRFPSSDPITAALAEDVVRVINEQAISIRAEVVDVGGSNHVQILGSGPEVQLQGRSLTGLEVIQGGTSNALAILGFGREGDVTDIGGASPSITLTAPAGAWTAADIGTYVTVTEAANGFFNDGTFLITDFSTAGGVDTLTLTNKYGRVEAGSPAKWFIGLRDDNTNPLRPPKHRYGQALDLSVEINVLAESTNVRGEMVDLINSFFGFFLEQKFFTFFGRSTFSGQTVTNEHYQIVINPPLRSSAESEIPRPTDGVDKVYLNAFGLSVTTSMYIDRELYFPGTDTPLVGFEGLVTEDTTLPIPGAEEE